MSAPVAALAGVIATLFTIDVARQYRSRQRLHQLAWAAGLALYAAASFVEAYVAARGWTPGLYRAYFPMAALLVGLLGLGTMYLVPDHRVGHVFAVFVLLAGLGAAVGQFAAPLDAALLQAEGESAGLGAVGGFPRYAAAALNIGGGLALIVGALGSWWSSRNAGVLLIGLGALLPFAGGGLSSLGTLDARVLLQLAGIAVIYAGFKLSFRGPRRVHGTESEPPATPPAVPPR